MPCVADSLEEALVEGIKAIQLDVQAFSDVESAPEEEQRQQEKAVARAVLQQLDEKYSRGELDEAIEQEFSAEERRRLGGEGAEGRLVIDAAWGARFGAALAAEARGFAAAA